MKFEPTAIDGVVRIELEPIRDERGFFARAWGADEFAAAGIETDWIQLNLGRNPKAGTLRGMHYQTEPHGEAKLVRCTRGRLQDVAVDMRPASPTYRRWVSADPDRRRRRDAVPAPGCAHGYLTLEPDTDLLYQASARYVREAATGVRFDDPAFGIEWAGPITLVSDADRAWPLQDAR